MYHKLLVELYGNVGDIHTIKEFRKRYEDFANEATWLSQEMIEDVSKAVPLDFMIRTAYLGVSYEVLLHKDGEEWWLPFNGTY